MYLVALFAFEKPSSDCFFFSSSILNNKDSKKKKKKEEDCIYGGHIFIMPTLYLQQLSKDDALIFFSPLLIALVFFLFGVYLTSVFIFLLFSLRRERERSSSQRWFMMAHPCLFISYRSSRKKDWKKITQNSALIRLWESSPPFLIVNIPLLNKKDEKSQEILMGFRGKRL